jgi:hypothetical protein
MKNLTVFNRCVYTIKLKINKAVFCVDWVDNVIWGQGQWAIEFFFVVVESMVKVLYCSMENTVYISKPFAR